MSNKPKIHATCKAGCLWETVHLDDFKRSASIVELPKNEIGSVIVDMQPQTYRIATERSKFGTDTYDCGVTVYADDSGNPFLLDGKVAMSIDIPFDEYRDYFDFEILRLTTTGTDLTLVYEINGERKTKTMADGVSINIENAYIVFSNVKAVYLFNRYATIEAKVGSDIEQDISDAINKAITTALNTEV